MRLSVLSPDHMFGPVEDIVCCGVRACYTSAFKSLFSISIYVKMSVLFGLWSPKGNYSKLCGGKDQTG